MDTIKTAIVFAILVVIFIEFFSCFFVDWCVGDPRRDGLNTAMFTINFSAAFAAYIAMKMIVTPAVEFNTTNVFMPVKEAPAEAK